MATLYNPRKVSFRFFFYDKDHNVVDVQRYYYSDAYYLYLAIEEACEYCQAKGYASCKHMPEF